MRVLVAVGICTLYCKLRWRKKYCSIFYFDAKLHFLVGNQAINKTYQKNYKPEKNQLLGYVSLRPDARKIQLVSEWNGVGSEGT